MESVIKRMQLNGAQRRQTGFTMVELIVTMIVVGILAVAVAPRFDSLRGFDARGFRDQTVATLRFAQKTAIAQRRAVCVDVSSGSGVELTIDQSTTPDDSCDGPLRLPATQRAGTGLAGSNFQFLRMGETSQTSGTITLTINDADNILIDAVTGYVR